MIDFLLDDMPRLEPTRNDDGHSCEEYIASSAFGGAVTECFEDERGRLWVTNGEYASMVWYCPFCGEEAPTTPTRIPKDQLGDMSEGDSFSANGYDFWIVGESGDHWICQVK